MTMLDLVPGWTVDLDRGPDWLFVRLHASDEPSREVQGKLSEEILRLLQQQFARRLVLEMDDVPLLVSELLGELLTLHERISTSGGLMRICGLSRRNYAVLRKTSLSDRFPDYRNREEAVMGGGRPPQPR